MLAYIEVTLPILGGIFAAGLVLGLLIQLPRLTKAASKKRRAEQEMLKMQTQMLGMNNSFKVKKD